LKKIAVFHLLYSFDEIGGLENGLINLINNLGNDIFTHIICSLTKIGKIQDRIKVTNLRYYSLNKKEGNDIRVPVKIYSLLKKEKPDIVHLRNWPTMVEGYMASRLAGIKKIIYSEHGRHFEAVWKKQKIKTGIIKHILSSVDECLTVSKNVAVEMEDLYKLKRNIQVIHNGVDTSRFFPNPNLEFKKKYAIKNGPIIGTIGRLVPGKKIDELIKQYDRFNKNITFIIVGDGPEKEKLTNLSKKHGEGRIFLVGHQDEIPLWLNTFDLFVLPSESEGLSNVLMEAISCALPTAAFDIGGNREIIYDCKGGILVEKNNMLGLVKTINNIFCNKEIYDKMRAFNRNLALKEFSLKKMVKEYTKLYLKNLG